MDDRKLKDMIDSRSAAPDENARKEALNLALAAFDEAHEKNSQKTTQGSGLWGRLTGRSNQNGQGRNDMNRKMVFGGMATAMAVILAVGLGSQQMGQDTATALFAPEGPANVSMEIAAADFAAAPPVAMPAAPMEMMMAARDEGIAVQKRGGEARLSGGVMGMAEPGMAVSSIYPHPGDMMVWPTEQGRDNFARVGDNPVKLVKEEPVSTFSVDVDTASYSFVRRQINSGTLPAPEMVRIEEMVNYFDYLYDLPASRSAPFAAHVTVVPSPWAEGRKLMHIGIKGYDIPVPDKPRSNIVFLIDVSGSMNGPDRLPLLKASAKLLLDQLRPEDTVAIVTYAGHAGTVLEPTKVSEKAKIIAALDALQPGGSTAGAAGIEQAYRLAEQHSQPQSEGEKVVSRVILATDGDFNVGVSSTDELKTLIETKRRGGVYLSILGFGRGNFNDHLMQTLAQNGNGTAAYIDTLNEARKVLVEEVSSTLFTIAQDVKIQVEFNPATVAEYRLIGYETRHLNREDFNNDKVDAGDIGSGHTVTAIYEITPVGGPTLVDASRYAAAEEVKAATDFGDEYAFLKIRYKEPGEDVSQLITTPVTTANARDAATGDVAFGIAVAGFGQILKGGAHMQGFGYDEVIAMAQAAKGDDMYGYRGEFINLVRLAKALAGE